jgi:hypothetical protein
VRLADRAQSRGNLPGAVHGFVPSGVIELGSSSG